MSLLRKAVLGVALNGLALYGITYALSEVNYRGGLTFFIIGGLIIGLLNTLVKPILKVVSLPLVFITAGVFLIVINTLILWLTKQIIDILSIADVVLEIQGLTNYLIAGFLFGIINWVEHLFVHNR